MTWTRPKAHTGVIFQKTAAQLPSETFLTALRLVKILLLLQVATMALMVTTTTITHLIKLSVEVSTTLPLLKAATDSLTEIPQKTLISGSM